MNETLNQTVQVILNQTNSSIFGHTLPLTQSPTIDIFIITVITSLFITLVNKYMSDQNKIKLIRSEIKKLQKKLKEQLKEDPKKAQKLQQEIMKKNFENMKNSFNPKIMLITMIPMMFIFLEIKHLYSPFGDIFHIFGFSFGWLGTYIIFSIINSMILKKVLDVA